MRLAELAATIPWQITPDALDAMLAIASREEIDPEELAAHFHGPKSLALRNGQKRDDSRTMRMRDGVAVIPIDGPIYRYADYFTQVSGGVTTEQLARDFGRAVDDVAVSAILFTIDSPGGEATGIGELSDAIFAARGKKPIAAYIEGFGASAAYHIASAADLVVVDDDALVGSIGTIMGVADPAKRVSRTIDFVSSQSPKKRPDPTTDEGRAYLQQLVDDMTEVFIAKVARNRTLDRAQVVAIEGGILVGRQAIDAGLADVLGSEESTIKQLIERAAVRPALPGLPALPAGVRPLPLRQESKPMDWKSFWSGMFQSAAEAEGTPIAAAIEPRQLVPGESLTAAALPATSSITSSTAILQSVDPERDAREERIAALEAQLAKQEAAQIQARAEAFADNAVRAHQALPAERGALVSLYVQAATDDSHDGGGRVAQVEALIVARPAHNLTQEAVAVGAGGVLETTAPKELTDARRQQLLSMTPTGQAALARRSRTA